MLIAGMFLGAVLGIILTTLLTMSKIVDQQGLINASRTSLRRAENKVEELNEENNYLHEENKDLRYDNEEQEDILKEINSLTASNTYNNEKIILNKIKELVHDYQSGN